MFWTEESIAFLRDAAAINRYYETIAAIMSRRWTPTSWPSKR